MKVELVPALLQIEARVIGMAAVLVLLLSTEEAFPKKAVHSDRIFRDPVGLADSFQIFLDRMPVSPFRGSCGIRSYKGIDHISPEIFHFEQDRKISRHDLAVIVQNYVVKGAERLCVVRTAVVAGVGYVMGLRLFIL